jgi:hypothetical protein
VERPPRRNQALSVKKIARKPDCAARKAGKSEWNRINRSREKATGIGSSPSSKMRRQRRELAQIIPEFGQLDLGSAYRCTE